VAGEVRRGRRRDGVVRREREGERGGKHDRMKRRIP
jgi:hypothetical protein